MFEIEQAVERKKPAMFFMRILLRILLLLSLIGVGKITCDHLVVKSQTLWG